MKENRGDVWLRPPGILKHTNKILLPLSAGDCARFSFLSFFPGFFLSFPVSFFLSFSLQDGSRAGSQLLRCTIKHIKGAAMTPPSSSSPRSRHLSMASPCRYSSARPVTTQRRATAAAANLPSLCYHATSLAAAKLNKKQLAVELQFPSAGRSVCAVYLRQTRETHSGLSALMGSRS